MWFEGNTHDVISLDRATFGRVSADADKLVVTDSLFFGKVDTLPDGFSSVRSGLSCNRYVAQLQVLLAVMVPFYPLFFLCCFFVPLLVPLLMFAKTYKSTAVLMIIQAWLQENDRIALLDSSRKKLQQIWPHCADILEAQAPKYPPSISVDEFEIDRARDVHGRSMFFPASFAAIIAMI